MPILYRFLVCAFVMMVLSSCHPERPSDVISESKMESILYDYHLAQALADESRDSIDYHRYAYIQKVFDKHGITEAEFDSSMVWYSSNSGYLYKIYRNLHERFAAEAAQAGVNQSASVYADLTADGDTANIWTGSSLLSFIQETAENIYSFKYEADTTFHMGDQFVFHGNVRFLQRDGLRGAALALYVRYAGDSVSAETYTMRQDMEFDLNVSADTSLVIKEIGGVICMLPKEKNDGMIRRMFVIDPVLVRIHHYFEPQIVDTVVTDTLCADSLDSQIHALDSVDAVIEQDDAVLTPNVAGSFGSKAIVNKKDEKRRIPPTRARRRKNR